MIMADESQKNGLLSGCQVNIGVEVEKLRVDRLQRISKESFPVDFAPSIQRFLGREYFEAQIEFAFPPTTDIVANVDQGEKIIREVARELAPKEYLWPFSCPPILPSKLSARSISRIPAATYPYRLELSHLYDIKQLMNNGVHINVSFDKASLADLMAYLGLSKSDDLYIKIAQQFMLHQWLFTYLFGATPECFSGYLDSPRLGHPVRSLRSSRLGFPTSVCGDYRSVSHYVRRINSAIRNGDLLKAGQYYESVRLKSNSDKSLQGLLKDGISHLELRAFDLNPCTINGITANQLRLVRILTIFFATLPRLSDDALEARMKGARRLNGQVALEDPRQPSFCQQSGLKLLKQLERFACLHQFASEDISCLR